MSKKILQKIETNTLVIKGLQEIQLLIASAEKDYLSDMAKIEKDYLKETRKKKLAELKEKAQELYKEFKLTLIVLEQLSKNISTV